jgi:hypothetical protein
MNKLKIAVAAAVVASGLLSQTPSFAGSYYGTSVYVGSNLGYGAVLATRDSADSNASIGCYIGAYVTNADVTNTSTITYLSCGATDSTGKYYGCYVNNPPASWVTMMASINEVSWIYFYGDSAGHCQGLNISQGSSYL